MIVFAHRGHHGFVRRQNGMAAFRSAATRGWGIETDLRTTSDGVVVLHHDRCADGTPVDRITHRALERLAGEVATLRDLLDADLGVPLNLDVKTTEAFTSALGMMIEGRERIALVSAFRHDIAVAAADAGLPGAYLMASRPQSGARLPPRRASLETIVFDYDMIDEELMARVGKSGMSVVSYGALTEDENLRLRDLGVVASITDRPDHCPVRTPGTTGRGCDAAGLRSSG